MTFGLALTKRHPWREVPAYWCGQVIGAVIGALAIWAIFGHTAIVNGMGQTHFNQATTAWGSAIFAEGIGTFMLMFAILGIVDHRSPGDLAGLVIGGVVIGIISRRPGHRARAKPSPRLRARARVGDRRRLDPLEPADPPYILPGLVGSGIAAVTYDFIAHPRVTVDEIPEAVTHPDPGAAVPAH